MKERTLVGPLKGRALAYGYANGQALTLAVWAGLLIVKRDWPALAPYAWRSGDLLLLGGLWWRAVPHALGNNPRNAIYYPDTLLNAMTWLIRPWLVPGLRPEQRFWRWLRAEVLNA